MEKVFSELVRIEQKLKGQTSAVEITLKIQFLVNKTSQYSHIHMLLKCIILQLQHH